MQLLLRLAREYPLRSVLTLGCLLLGGLAEGIGLSSLLPLLRIAAPGGAGGGSPATSPGTGSHLETAIHSGFAALGLEPSVGLLLALIVAGMTAKAALVLLANRQVGYTVAHVTASLRLALIRALLTARWQYYTRQPAGSILSSFASEAHRSSQAYLHGTKIVAASIQALLYGGIAALLSWKALLGAMLIGALTAFVLNRLVRASRRAGVRQTQVLGASLKHLTDSLQGVKPLKAMARELLIGPLLEREIRRLNRVQRRQVLAKEAMRALQEPILVAALAGGLYVALSRWGLELSTLLMLSFLFYQTLSKFNAIQKEYQAMAVGESAYWSILRTIERAQQHRESQRKGAVPTLERSIELRGVSFSYADAPILQGVSLEIPAGQVTALTGPSGEGKTTVADLVIGLLRPDSGEVWIDDTPLGRADLTGWRSQIGYVPQETFLLHESVLVNVTLGDPELTALDARRALVDAGAWSFVKDLDGDLEASVGERGTLLSGGQRQRIMIARALVHRPKLLVLDEATASLDPESERAVRATLERLRGALTILTISHQRELVDAADRVYRVEGGDVKRI